MSGKQLAKYPTMSTKSALGMVSSFQSQEETAFRRNGRIIPSLLVSSPKNGMVSTILFFGMSFFAGPLVYRVSLLDWCVGPRLLMKGC